MKLIVNKTVQLKGKVTPPSSKSHTIRGIILATLCKGTSVLLNTLDSDDIQDAILLCQQLGVEIIRESDFIKITSRGLPLSLSTQMIQSGNSGITTHFSLPILGLRENPFLPVFVNCKEQMRNRPIQSLIKALKNLGLTIHYLENQFRLPIAITGELTGGKTAISGMSSQYLSALLIALPCAKKESEIWVEDLQERPYVDMTLSWLQSQNIIIHHRVKKNKDIYKIPGNQHYTAFNKVIPNDFSSASYLIAACALIPSEVTISGLDLSDLQPDKAIISLLQEMGANIEVNKGNLKIFPHKKLQGITIDANHFPDLLPILAVIGTQAEGKTEIINVENARIKETDRIHSIFDGLKKMGAKIEEKKAGLVIYPSHLKGNQVKGYHDHRTVMALSIAGLLADGKTFIDNLEAINKTFPQFITLMQSLGADMEADHVTH